LQNYQIIFGIVFQSEELNDGRIQIHLNRFILRTDSPLEKGEECVSYDKNIFSTSGVFLNPGGFGFITIIPTYSFKCVSPLSLVRE